MLYFRDVLTRMAYTCGLLESFTTSSDFIQDATTRDPGGTISMPMFPDLLSDDFSKWIDGFDAMQADFLPSSALYDHEDLPFFPYPFDLNQGHGGGDAH